jgi:hypothetical protein
LLTEALSGLATAGGAALIAAMVGDGWSATKVGFARLLGRGNAAREQSAAEKLEQTRTDVVTGRDEPTMAAARAVWTARLVDLLEEQPQVAEGLRVLVEQVNAAGSEGPVSQRIVALDNAQVAVQGHGSQVNTFGGERPSEAADG